MASPNGQHLFIFGLGYTGTRLAKAAVEQGYSVTGTVRDESKTREIERAVPGINVIVYKHGDDMSVRMSVCPATEQCSAFSGSLWVLFSR